VSERRPARRQVLTALGTAGGAFLAGCTSLLDTGDSGGGDSDGDESEREESAGGESNGLERLWSAGTPTEYGTNHHRMGVVRVDGEPVVGVPRSERPDVPGCGLLAVDGDGEKRWSRDLPAEACDPHSVGDVAAGTIDGEQVFLVATIQKEVVAYSAGTGEPRFEADLIESVPYGAPVVSPELADGSRRIVVVDNSGNLVVARPDGSRAWTRAVDGVVYPAPVVRDVDGDGSVEVVVTTDIKSGWVLAFGIDGEPRWRTEFETGGRELSSIDREEGRDIVLSTWDGNVAAVDGASGDVRWSEPLADRGLLGDSDSERLYATEGNGVVHAVNPEDGSVTWTVDSVATDAPANGPVVGTNGPEGQPVVASLSYDGTLGLIDPDRGNAELEHSLGTEAYTRPLLTDLTGDGSDDMLVMFGDASVEAYTLPD
jgi:outer membrane protein assembly factor BamB